jgi:hypothetical protein
VEFFYPRIACGPALLESRIPEWFNDKSTNSFGTIQMHTDFGSDDEWEGYALFIVYEFHEPDRNKKKKKKNKNKRSMSMGILILEYLMAAILNFRTLFVNFKPMKLILKNP